MNGRCRRCDKIRSVPAPDGARIADFRCGCGGTLRRVDELGRPIGRPSHQRALGCCDYCGRRRSTETLRRLEVRTLVGMPLIIAGRPVHAAALGRGAMVCRWHGFVADPAAHEESRP